MLSQTYMIDAALVGHLVIYPITRSEARYLRPLRSMLNDV